MQFIDILKTLGSDYGISVAFVTHLSVLFISSSKHLLFLFIFSLTTWTRLCASHHHTVITILCFRWQMVKLKGLFTNPGGWWCQNSSNPKPRGWDKETHNSPLHTDTILLFFIYFFIWFRTLVQILYLYFQRFRHDSVFSVHRIINAFIITAENSFDEQLWIRWCRPADGAFHLHKRCYSLPEDMKQILLI